MTVRKEINPKNLFLVIIIIVKFKIKFYYKTLITIDSYSDTINSLISKKVKEKITFDCFECPFTKTLNM